MGVELAEHGHGICPHCDHPLEGREAVCPKCEGGLYGVPPKKANLKDKVKDVATKIENSAKSTASNVTEMSGQTVQKVSQSIGDHVIPAWSAVAKTSGEIVEKVIEKTPLSPNSHSEDHDTRPDMASNTPNTSNEPDRPMDIESLMVQGELLVSEGKEQQALKVFNTIIAEDPSNAMAWFNRGVIHEMSGSEDEAVKSFRVCIDMDPDHGPAAANIAVLLDRMGNSSDASKFANMALRSFPSHSKLTEIAGSQVPSTNQLNSQTVIQTTTDINPIQTQKSEPVTQPETQPLQTPQIVNEPIHQAVVEEEITDTVDIDSVVENASDLIKQQKPEDALELLRDLLHAEASEHPRAWRIAAASMAQLSLYDSAIEAFTYALDLDNSDAASWYNLGALYRRSGEEESAVACFNAALGLKPEYTKASSALADIHTNNGDLTSAIDAWRSLLTHEPKHEGGIRFAEILVSIGEGEGEVLEMATDIPTTLPEGPTLAKEALQYIPENDSQEVVTLRARAYTLSGSYPEAVKAWRSLVENDRDNHLLWEGMMKTFIAAGDQNTAEKCRQKISSLTGVVSEPVNDTKDALAVFETNEEPQAEDISEEISEVENTIDEPINETEEQTESNQSDDPWGDPWAEQEVPGDIEEIETPNPVEIAAAENILDQAPIVEKAPEPEPSPEVDLASAALIAQTQQSNSEDLAGTGKTDSNSIANQDVQWYNKGLALLADEKYEEAMSCFDRALPTFVNDDEMIVRILNARGNAFYYLKKFSDCIEAYHKAMQVNPSGVTGSTLYNMGTAYAEVERFEDAIKCFEQGMSSKRVNPLTGEHSKMAKEQIRRCKILLKEQQKKLKRFAKLQS